MPALNLPSGDAAIDWLAGKPGGGARVLTSMALRSALVASGLTVAGLRGRQLALCTAAAVVAIEIGVLAWAAGSSSSSSSRQLGRAMGNAGAIRGR